MFSVWLFAQLRLGEVRGGTNVTSDIVTPEFIGSLKVTLIATFVGTFEDPWAGLGVPTGSVTSMVKSEELWHVTTTWSHTQMRTRAFVTSRPGVGIGFQACVLPRPSVPEEVVAMRGYDAPPSMV